MRLGTDGQTARSAFRRILASALASAQIETTKRLERTVLGYCVECRKKVEIRNPKRVTLRSKPPAVKDACPKCGTRVFLINGA